MRSAFLCIAFMLFSYTTACAFNDPVDTVGPLTLRIENIPPVERLNTPFEVSVTLLNSGRDEISGSVRIGVIDEWRVIGQDKLPFRIPPQSAESLAFKLTAGSGTHAALYPVHAYAEFGRPPRRAHAVAIVQVLPSAVAPKPPAAPTTRIILKPQPGQQLPLEVPRFWQPFLTVDGGNPLPLPPGFSGSEAATGAMATSREADRGGVLPAIAVHPPWRTGWGTIWLDYNVLLPPTKPILLSFSNAIRDHTASEPPSDGVQFRVYVIHSGSPPRLLFDRFTDSKRWQSAEVDLSEYAGKKITLRLWAGPGPRNDTTCDEGYWGKPTLIVGPQKPAETEASLQRRESTALERARSARLGKKAPFSWLLRGIGETCGAALIPGPNGITDSVIAFSGAAGNLVLKGVNVQIDGLALGAERSALAVHSRRAEWQNGKAVFLYRLDSNGLPCTAKAVVYSQGGALRIQFSMPNVRRNARGNPRFTLLSIGPANRRAVRVYAGFGNVVSEPQPFDLWAGGFTLSTRHVGADYDSGLSLVQASDVFPDVFRVRPQERLYALVTHHDATLSLIPSSHGAFAAARTYREHVAKFRPAPGVAVLSGKMCLDQWGGDYLQAAADIRRAAAYGIRDAVFVKHVWQRWGYDYRLPDIFPPEGGLERFLQMVRACKQTGILFVPHDNYIDFYPDATGFSYKHILFNEDGTPQLAWYNEWRRAQSYRWSPLAFKPFLLRNMRLLRRYVAPDGIFVDVFSAIAPMDFYDRSGRFYPKTVTLSKWGECFDLFRAGFGPRSVTISEAGCDGLIGHLDGGESDHGSAFGTFAGWNVRGADAERVPWHDMASHGSFILFAGGLGDRYRSGLPSDEHGYGSDDYLTTTVLGGRNPMCDGPFNRRAVMTYWLLHDVCANLARQPMLAHRFVGGDIHRQEVRFGGNGLVVANRGSTDWMVQGKVLPPFGFIAKCGSARAEITRRNGVITAYSESPNGIFVDARTPFNPIIGRGPITPAKVELIPREPGRFSLRITWTVHAPIPADYQPYLHFSDLTQPGEGIVFQGLLSFDGEWRSPGTHSSTADLTLPPEIQDGRFAVRFGLWNPKTGGRMVPRGRVDEGGRALGGYLIVRNRTCSYQEEPLPENPRVNYKKTMVTFGTISTNGAFRITGTGRSKLLMPLPESDEFRVRIKLPKGSNKLTVTALAENWLAVGQLPVSIKAGTAEFSVPAGTFACRLLFGKG